MCAMTNGDDSPIGIGEMLKEARQRAGLDISEVEQRTKIRTRYLRALESEDWDALPGEVYARGFLRTYAQLLDLDADAIVDEYRRRREAPRAPGYPIGEPMRRARLRADQTGRDWAPGRGLAIGGLVVILLVVLAVLGLTGGDNGGGGGPETTQAQSHNKPNPAPKHNEPAPPPPLKLTLIANTTVPVCLLNGDGKKLLDETMSAGEQKEFDSYTYQLLFPQGFDLPQIKVLANGEQIDMGVDPSGPVGYKIARDGSISNPSPISSTECA
jgi:cytoskeleton protein RodZ